MYPGLKPSTRNLSQLSAKRPYIVIVNSKTVFSGFKYNAGLLKMANTDKDSKSKLIIQTCKPLAHGKTPVCQDTDIYLYPAFWEKTEWLNVKLKEQGIL